MPNSFCTHALRFVLRCVAHGVRDVFLLAPVVSEDAHCGAEAAP